MLRFMTPLEETCWLFLLAWDEPTQYRLHFVGRRDFERGGLSANAERFKYEWTVYGHHGWSHANVTS